MRSPCTASTSIGRQGRQRPRTVSRQASKLRRGLRRMPSTVTSTGLFGLPAQVTVRTTSSRNQMMQSRGSRVTESTSAPAAIPAKAAAGGKTSARLSKAITPSRASALAQAAKARTAASSGTPPIAA